MNVFDGSTEQQDRLSALPDELIHRILSFGVKLNEVVRTCILSKRWVNVWSTFPDLNFTPLRFFVLRGDAKYVDFISKFLLARAHRVDACSIHIDLRESNLGKSAGGQVLLNVHQAVSHCLQEFCMSFAKLDSYLSFPILTNLTLNNCDVSFTKWSLPLLTTLELDIVCPHGDQSVLSFKEFHCLKNLSLGGNCGMFYHGDPEFFRIDPPNLENLDIFQGLSTEIPGCKFVISAPKLKSFRFYGRYVPVVSAEGGLPCLEQVWFLLRELDENQVNQSILKISSLFRVFRLTKVLTLFPETFEIFSRFPNFFKCQPSPFVNLKSVYLRGYRPELQIFQHLSGSDNHVIKYLLSNSPGAEFMLQIVG